MNTSALELYGYVSPGTTAPAALGHHPRFTAEWVGPGHPSRTSLEHFIRDVFAGTYGAAVHTFADDLLGCRDPAGRWVAALGFTRLQARPAFLEHYLDQAIETAISDHTGQPVSRQNIAEVGNLAALHPGAARWLIELATRHLASESIPWVVFTATRGLLNAITRLQLAPREIAPADPSRLPDQGKSWGSYYDTNPMVMYGFIPGAIDKLDS